MSTIQKGKILREDLNLYDGVQRTATRIDSTGGTITGNTIGDVIDVLSVYGADYTARNATTINAAVIALGSKKAILQLATGTWAISDSITVPSNLTLYLPDGCDVTVSAASTISGYIKVDPGATFTSNTAALTASGTIDNSGTFAIAFATTISANIIRVGALNITAATTLSGDILIEPGGLLTHGAAVTCSGSVTALGPNAFTGTGALSLSGTFNAGPYNVFTGSGTVTIAGYCEVKYAEWWGSTGTSDDTTPLQAVLTSAGRIQLLPKTYTTDMLTLASDTTLIFDPATVIKAKTGYAASDRVFDIQAISNFVVHGNHGTIQMLKSEYTSGESRHCVRIYESTNITFYDLIVKDSGGDGFAIGGGANQTSYNINLYNCVADNHRRNGLSITNVVGMNVIGGEYKNTDGTAPQFGIDIEPNSASGYLIQDINIRGVRTYNNTGGGISVVPPYADAPISVNISDWTSEYDGQNGGFLASSGGLGMTSKLYGEINLTNSHIIQSQCSGILIQKWNENSPQLNIRNISITDVAYNETLSDTSDTYRCGLINNVESTHTGTYHGNWSAEDISIQDTRGTPRTYIPVYIRDAKTTDFQNILVKDIKANSWTSTQPSPTLITASTTSNVRVLYTEGYTVASQSTQTLTKHFYGTTIPATTSSNFTLPAAANVIGAEYSFAVLNAGLIYILMGDASDVIENYSPYAGAGIISREEGARITLRSLAANQWQVMHVSGGWGVVNFFGQRYPYTLYTAAPSAGTWAVGDKIYNSAPSVDGNNMVLDHWVCTVAGTPGTWVAQYISTVSPAT